MCWQATQLLARAVHRFHCCALALWNGRVFHTFARWACYTSRVLALRAGLIHDIVEKQSQNRNHVLHAAIKVAIRGPPSQRKGVTACWGFSLPTQIPFSLNDHFELSSWVITLFAYRYTCVFHGEN
jgi:hypothetical protein